MLQRRQIATAGSPPASGGEVRLSCVLLCLIPLAGSGPAFAQARTTEIVVSWVTVEHGIRPRQGVWRSSRSVRLNLGGGNVIAETRNVSAGGRTNTLNTAGRFRDRLNAARTVQSSWRVQDSRSLVRTESRPQHTETIRIGVDSQNRCHAAISYRLKAGFREYRMTSLGTGRPVYLSALSAEQVTCTITSP
jgi:hypothetical protein